MAWEAIAEIYQLNTRVHRTETRRFVKLLRLRVIFPEGALVEGGACAAAPARSARAASAEAAAASAAAAAAACRACVGTCPLLSFSLFYFFRAYVLKEYVGFIIPNSSTK